MGVSPMGRAKNYQSYRFIIIRDHPFKTSANFYDFWPLPPSRLRFFNTVRRQIFPIFWLDLFIEAMAEILEIFRVFLEIWRHQKDILKLIDL